MNTHETMGGETGGANSTEWDDMAESVSVTKRLEDGESPKEILDSVYQAGALTPDYIEEHAADFLQYGLKSDELERFDQLSREPKKKSLEEIRRRADEEPETAGYETDAA